MQLFAIIAKVDEVSDYEDSEESNSSISSTNGKIIIESFLKSELSSSDVQRYLNIFEERLNETRGQLYSKKSGQKRTSLQAVKVLRICSQINEELTQRQKFIVVVRLFEFINSDANPTEKELDFVTTTADAFNISSGEFKSLQAFIECTPDALIDLPNHFYYSGKKLEFEKAKSALVDGLDAPIHVLRVQSIKTMLFRYYGRDELMINGQIVDSEKTHIFNVGATIRTGKIAQIYYSDLVSKISDQKKYEIISFQAKNVLHHFDNRTAVQELTFETNSGTMIGIMGGSGTGKTTLMNIFNGKIAPTQGNILINGIDLHTHPKDLEGIIGNVSQSDLLIEELTVFENLYFAAKLCLGNATHKQLTKKVVHLLQDLGLYESRNLKVGSPLKKVISGGQRKRLNIALELIRKPKILFVDEPTSGLSSRDSENIMDLLKELSLKGTMVFVVIHQPSSNIFKLFDRLLIIDEGGYLIFDGIPLNAMVHFKTYSFQGNSHESECSLCGNVTPEQIFSIIDSKIVDEYGNETGKRKKDPKDWHELYKQHRFQPEIALQKRRPNAGNELPSKLIQFFTYVRRDFLSKISNVQYLIVNGLVAPSLALLLSFFIKFFSTSAESSEYSYYLNENIPQYIFIAVIVSIFLGLTVSAEEINKDKEILERESFLNLSRSSYLLSKVTILFSISAIQSLLFVLIGNSILEIKGLYLEYWLILFSTSCLSNLMGLSISSAFNSAKVIYIIVPLLIIPQLLFSGAIVKFDKLHPSLSNATQVPWIGNMMVSRWSYEALAVEQGVNNDFEKHFFEIRTHRRHAMWTKDFWINAMNEEIAIIVNPTSTKEEKASAKRTLINEIEEEDAFWGNLDCINCINQLKNKRLETYDDFSSITVFLDIVKAQSIKTVNDLGERIEQIKDSLGTERYLQLQNDYSNESLMNLLTNKNEKDKLLNVNNRIYQNSDPVFHVPRNTSFLDVHFYAPKKYIFGKRISTYWANFVLIWIIAVLTYIALYFDLLRKFVEFVGRFGKRFQRKGDELY